jgi:hypothetical protein
VTLEKANSVTALLDCQQQLKNGAADIKRLEYGESSILLPAT